MIAATTPFVPHRHRSRQPATRGRPTVRASVLAVLFGALASGTGAREREGTVYQTDGSQADVKAALADAQAGDTVRIPPGTFTYGANGDFFCEIQDRKFDGSSGVGIGPRAAMDAIQPTRAKVGFWVTDEGEWNAKNAGPDGRLYTWDGKAWTLKYTPYTYPHPLRARDETGPPQGPKGTQRANP